MNKSAFVVSATRGFDQQSMIVLASSRILERVRRFWKSCRQYTQNLFDMLNSWLPSASGDISRARAALRVTGASAIHVRCMDKLTVDAVREIEQIHSSWIEFEVAGEDHSLMALCADDIELWPPDAQPVLGRAAVSAQLVRSTTRIYAIEITDRRIRGSNEIAYLTASYKTTFSSAQDSTRRQAVGSHLWILEKRAGEWVVTLVSWSVWDLAATFATRPPSTSSAGST